MKKTTSHICLSEKRFLELKGDGTESVKVTVEHSGSHQLNGWYVLFKDLANRNRFVRQSPDHPSLIDIISCETKYLQFYSDLGILPDLYHFRYEPVGKRGSKREYEGLQKKLEEVGEWKE